MARSRRMCAMLLLVGMLALESHGELLCAIYRTRTGCVIPTDERDGTVSLKNPETEKCYKSLGGNDLGEVDCGASDVLRFEQHKPHPNMFKAVGLSNKCLDTAGKGTTLWGCGGEDKLNQQYTADGFLRFYEVPCKRFAVSSKEEAFQCKCIPLPRDGPDSPTRGVGTVRSHQNCLDGRVRGRLGGRVMNSIYAENVCSGEPMPMMSYPDWEEDNSMYVSWAEDTDSWSSGAVHVTKIRFVSGEESRVVASIRLPRCLHNGQVTRGKGDTIAVLCAEDEGWEKALNLKVIEVAKDLSREIRRFTVLPEGCTAGDCKGTYPKQKGATFRLLTYVARHDYYVVSHNAMWGSHVADATRYVNATTTEIIPGKGDSWACMGGHTETMRLAYNPQVDEVAVICASDFGGKCTDPAKQNCDETNSYKNGLTFRTMTTSMKGKNLAPYMNSHYQAVAGWLGSLLPCGDDFVLAWHGPQRVDSFANETNDVGVMRVTKTGEVVRKAWVVQTKEYREKSVRLAKLGTGDCDRFLLGWGEMAKDRYYPERYYVVELDGTFARITDPVEVTNVTMWGEDTNWVTLGSGDVAWMHTWKRNDDGSPNKVGQYPTKEVGGKSATYNGNGYGYTWGTFDGAGGRFHTNEAFSSRYMTGDRPPSSSSAAAVSLALLLAVVLL